MTTEKLFTSVPITKQQQQPFNGLWSGTTRIGRYQKKQLLWIFMEQGRIMEAEAPTDQVGANRTNSAPTPTTHPRFFTGRMPFLPPEKR